MTVEIHTGQGIYLESVGSHDTDPFHARAVAASIARNPPMSSKEMLARATDLFREAKEILDSGITRTIAEEHHLQDLVSRGKDLQKRAEVLLDLEGQRVTTPIAAKKCSYCGNTFWVQGPCKYCGGAQ